MSNNWDIEAHGPIGARLGKVEAVPVTGTSAIIDMATLVNIYEDLKAGRLVLAVADGGTVYYAFNSENAGSIDDTATTAGAATACMPIPSGTSVAFRPPMQTQQEVNSSGGAITTTGMCRYLLIKCATGTATLRLAVQSEAVHKRMS